MLINKIVIGVSGGPDSMNLLDQLRRNKKFEAIVVHVNYNFREESVKEQELVQEYCHKHGVTLIIHDLDEEAMEDYSYLGNKQSIARAIRYDAYFEACKEFDAKHIFIAQHKDDFIETALMQESRSTEDYLFYGIEELSINNGIMIHRPLIDKWKKDIIEENDLNKIPYLIDKSNLEPIYERNKVRIELKSKTEEEKEEIYLKFMKINESKKQLREDINNIYEKLVESDFDYEVYSQITDEYKKYVIYKWLINNNITRININSDKIEGIKEFLYNKRGDKAFRLMENVFMSIKKGKINIYTNQNGYRK